MATMDITSSTKSNFKVRVEYSAGGGAISITNIGGARTDNFDSSSQNSQNRVNITIGSSSVSAVPSNNTVKFTKNNNFSNWSVGHSASGLSGNTSISVNIYAPTNSTIHNLTFNATINAGTSATAPTGAWCNITSYTETSVTLSGGYASDGGSAITTNGYQYKTQNGSWTNCGQTVTGLSPNTAYWFRYYVGNAIGTTYSGEPSVTTFNYPYISSMPSFTIGNPLTITLYNPLGRELSLYGLGNDNSQIFQAYNFRVNSLTGFNDPTSINSQYASIPNSREGNYRVRLVCAELSRDTTVNGDKYYIKNDGSEVPNFSNTDWSYTANLTSLTNNNQCVINGYSTITYSIDNSASSNYHATISKYNLKWGNASQESTSGYTVSNGNGNVLSVEAVDSRQLLRSTSKTLVSDDTYVPYTLPVIDYSNTSVTREDGIGAETKLTIKGNLSVTKFGNLGVSNTLYSAGYKVYNYDNNTWSNLFSISTNEFTIDSNGAFTLQNYLIHANGTSGGFEVGKRYLVQIELKDAQGLLGTLTSSNLVVTDGKISRDVYQDVYGNYHQGINGLAASLYNNIIYGKEKVTQSLTIPNNNANGYGITDENDNSILKVTNSGEAVILNNKMIFHTEDLSDITNHWLAGATNVWCNGIGWLGGTNTLGNDFGWIKFNEYTTDSGYMEIATADGGNEPIYIRQYAGANIVRTLTLLDTDGNTRFPANIYAYVNNTALAPTYNGGNILYFRDSNGTYMHCQRESGTAKGINWWDSDKRLKGNIKDTKESGLNIINKIEHKAFTKYKELDKKDVQEEYKIGYIANQLQNIDPQLVFGVEQDNGIDPILNININVLIPYMTKAIQELSEENNQLKERISKLEKK